MARIRQYASTDKKGTNVLGMVEAAEKLGFEAKGVRGVLDSLAKIPLPAIANVVVKEVLQHYVVIYKVSNTDVVYMDPGDGNIHKEAIAEFRKNGLGYCVVTHQQFTPQQQKVFIASRLWALMKPHKVVLINALVPLCSPLLPLRHLCSINY